jgi:hypothetical protein
MIVIFLREYFHYNLDCTKHINPIPHIAYKVIFQNGDAFQTWHDLLGYLRIVMMRKIIDNCISYNLKETKFPKPTNFMRTACATRKLILRPSPLTIHTETLKFLKRIQGDICGSIQPLCGSFRYFMILIDTSTRWSHVYLLSINNHAFAKFMTQVIKFKAIFPKY